MKMNRPLRTREELLALEEQYPCVLETCSVSARPIFVKPTPGTANGHPAPVTRFSYRPRKPVAA